MAVSVVIMFGPGAPLGTCAPFVPLVPLAPGCHRHQACQCLARWCGTTLGVRIVVLSVAIIER